MTKKIGFPTKKSMGHNQIPEEKLNEFLSGAKDEQMQENKGSVDITTNVDINDNNKHIQKTYTENVNVDVNVNAKVTDLIGRESVFEKSFSRQTYYVHNDLIKAVDKLARKGGKGAKTKIINAALEIYLESLQK